MLKQAHKNIDDHQVEQRFVYSMIIEVYVGMCYYSYICSLIFFFAWSVGLS